MKRKIKIYPKKTPYVAMVKRRPIHLNRAQYDDMVSRMGRGESMMVIMYHDPEGEERKIPINLFDVEMLDLATVVQREVWQSTGGYVCNDGSLVDSEADCFRGYDAPKEPSQFARAMAGKSKLELRKDARESLVTGFLCSYIMQGLEEKDLPEYIKKLNIDWESVRKRASAGAARGGFLQGEGYDGVR